MVEALGRFPGLAVIADENFDGKGGWKQRFPQVGPLYLELGTGKGQFLRQMAQKHPEWNFIGLEKEPGVLLQAVRTAHELGLTNLKFVLGDVQWLDRLFGSSEVDGLYIHFCDPWPKSRHDKRRLTHESFLRLYRQILAPAGVLRFKTDNLDLFEYSLASFAAAGMELTCVARDIHAAGANDSAIMTEYEAKFSAAGLPVYYCEARFDKSGEESASV